MLENRLKQFSLESKNNLVKFHLTCLSNLVDKYVICQREKKLYQLRFIQEDFDKFDFDLFLDFRHKWFVDSQIFVIFDLFDKKYWYLFDEDTWNSLHWNLLVPFLEKND